jgi:shikimate kinase
VLCATRDPLYREVADTIVDTGSQSVGNLAHRLEQQLLQHLSGAGRYKKAPLGAG